MKNIGGYIVGLLVGIIIGVVSLLWFKAMDKEAKKKQSEEISVVWRQNHFILSPENLMNELEAQGVAFPEIVLAQAILETGTFKSNACIYKNNLFGLRCSDGTYMYFDHWTDCVAAYKFYIQDWETPPEDYYNYLDSLGYAEDTSYIAKLKRIVR